MALIRILDKQPLCRMCLSTNQANKHPPKILDNDYVNLPLSPNKPRLLEETQAILNEKDAKSLTVALPNRPKLLSLYVGLLSQSFGLMAMIIGGNYLWLVYLRTGTIRNIPKQFPKLIWFWEVACLLWPKMDSLCSLFVGRKSMPLLICLN